MENSKYEDLCRLCATKTTMVLAINIFEHEGTIRQISKKIETCLPININQTDELPKMICENCLYKLELFCDFRERSVRTEKLLLELYKELSSSLLSDTQHTCLVPMDGNGLIIVPHQLLTNHNVSDLDLGPLDGRMIVQQEIIHLNSHSLDIMNSHSLSSQDYSNQSVLTQDSAVINSSGQSMEDSKFSDNLGLIQHQLLSEQFKLQHEYQIGIQNANEVSLANGVDTQDSDQSYSITKNLDHEGICSIEYEESKLVDNNTIDAYKHEDSNSGHSLHVDDHISNISPHDSVEAEKIYSLDSDSRQFYDLDSSNSESLLILSSNKNWFYCNMCGKSYEDKTMFEAHYNIHFHKCSLCLAVFTSEDVFLEHRTVCVEDSKLLNTEFSTAEMLIQKNPDPKLSNDDSDSEGDPNASEANRTQRKAPEPVDFDAKAPESLDLDPSTPEGAVERDEDSEDGPKQRKFSPKECKECGKTYKTNYKLTEHMRKHTGEKPYKCKSCEKAFRSKIGLAQHEAKHTGQYEFSCPTCGKGFQCKSYLIGHQRVHSNLKPYPCTTCGQNFKTKQSLLDHTNRHLGVKPYICDVCGRGFITKGVCRAHKKTHTGFDNRKYSCKICEKLFVSKSYLRTHLRIHTGEKPYMCEVCGKGFLTGVDLKIHSTMHTGEKSFVCEMCGKAFARQVALRCHRRSHTGERPYSCDLCGQTFTQFTPMAIHKRLHTGERPYACETCGKAFVSRSTMMSHAKKHHVR
ncbi:unnamed protein product [Phaedon cochleariae]|uniref:Uncharacterized protein n=1 Tax=Phaedon cochleariae TaxID=80249 RepID=A0A9N9SFT5_PHACE|nr:unnamed protein product [Phaedon cochleariae]